ncbi:hypothetical protein PG997_010472 [Apiospora hydei]|uniref:Uncharacterized protein n=1 Tax=Apiospora hydei TaxID=1337664 RepID=A0ABR1VX49_9PEZI
MRAHSSRASLAISRARLNSQAKQCASLESSHMDAVSRVKPSPEIVEASELAGLVVQHELLHGSHARFPLVVPDPVRPYQVPEDRPAAVGQRRVVVYRHVHARGLPFDEDQGPDGLRVAQPGVMSFPGPLADEIVVVDRHGLAGPEEIAIPIYHRLVKGVYFPEIEDVRVGSPVFDVGLVTDGLRRLPVGPFGHDNVPSLGASLCDRRHVSGPIKRDSRGGVLYEVDDPRLFLGSEGPYLEPQLRGSREK